MDIFTWGQQFSQKNIKKILFVYSAVVMKIRFKSPLRPSQNGSVPTPKAIADLFTSRSRYQHHSLP